MTPVPSDDQIGDRSTAELMRDLAGEVTTLFHKEIELAKAEMSQKGKRMGVGVGMFGAAGVAGMLALGALTACLIIALSYVLPAAVAAIIVAVVYAAIAAFLGLRGKEKVQEATPPVPEQAAESVKEDIRWAKTRTQSAKR